MELRWLVCAFSTALIAEWLRRRAYHSSKRKAIGSAPTVGAIILRTVLVVITRNAKKEDQLTPSLECH